MTCAWDAASPVSSHYRGHQLHTHKTLLYLAVTHVLTAELPYCGITAHIPLSGMLRSVPAKVVDKPSWQAPHQTGLFPVSVEWEPPFTMLVDLIGHGDHQVCFLPLQESSAACSHDNSVQPMYAPHCLRQHWA